MKKDVTSDVKLSETEVYVSLKQSLSSWAACVSLFHHRVLNRWEDMLTYWTLWRLTMGLTMMYMSVTDCTDLWNAKKLG